MLAVSRVLRALSVGLLLAILPFARAQSGLGSIRHHIHHLIGLDTVEGYVHLGDSTGEAYSADSSLAQPVPSGPPPPAELLPTLSGLLWRITASKRTEKPPLGSIPAAVIALARSKDRIKTMHQRLKAVGAKYQLVDAIDGREQLVPGKMVGTWRGFSTAVLPGLQPQPPQPYNFSIPASCPSTTVPHLSCTLSHFFTIFSAYQAGLEELLILEDDMEVLRWPTREALAAAPEAAGALQLYMLGNTANELYSRPPSTWVPWAPGIFNTGAYVINRRGMQRVLDTYLPGARAAGSLQAASLNFSSVTGSDCVADWTIYHAAGTWVSTDFFFLESGGTSDIQPENLGVHQTSKELVERLIAERGLSYPH